PSLAETILALAPDRGKLQAELVAALPGKIASTAATALLGAFARTGSMRLHAAVCCAAFTPLAAVKRHLEQAPDDAEVAVALARASDADYVAAALANNSDRLYSLAAAKAAAAPGLLAALDITS